MGSPLDDTDEPPVNLSRAPRSTSRPASGDRRWPLVHPETRGRPADQPDLAVHQRPNGKYSYKSMFSASSLRTNPIFTRIEPEQAE